MTHKLPQRRELKLEMKVIETPSGRIAEAIAILLTTCFSIDVNRAMDRIEDILQPMTDIYLVSGYRILPQGEPKQGDWTIKVTVEISRRISFSTITMGVRPVEGGMDTFMTLEEYHPYGPGEEPK